MIDEILDNEDEMLHMCMHCNTPINAQCQALWPTLADDLYCFHDFLVVI